MSKLKKYLLLFSVTLVLVVTIVMTGFAMQNDSSEAEVFALRPEDIENTVVSSGRLEYSSVYSVKSDSMSMINTVEVNPGDEVKKGDILYTAFKLDKKGEEELLKYYDIKNIAAYITDSSLKTDITAQIRENAVAENVISKGDGIVTELSISPDDFIDSNITVMKLSKKTELEIPLNINESYISKIKKGQRVNIKFTALGDKVFTGRVSELSDTATLTSGLSGKETTVKVIVVPDKDLKDSVRVGYSAECSIVTSVDKDALVMPYEYILSDDKGDYVYTLKDSRAKKTYIKTGNEYKTGMQILGGVSEKDLIINDDGIVSDGMKIKIKKSGSDE